jgi:riboflavin synthase alpha subunit
MFTGLIRDIGTVERIERPAGQGIVRLTVLAPAIASTIQPLESVAVNGVCLTAVEVRRGRMLFEMVPETLRLTTLGALRSGHRVHLEPSLSLADRLGGHLLLGHVDSTGTIIARRRQAGELTLEVRFAKALGRWLVPQGPVAVDGVSLTVGARVRPGRFTIHLIPETLRRTMLGERAVGERVNLELDYLAKLVLQGVTSRNRHASIE